MPNIFQRLHSAVLNKPFAKEDEILKKMEELLVVQKASTPAIAMVDTSFIKTTPEKFSNRVPKVSYEKLKRLRAYVSIVEVAIQVIKKEVSQCPWDIVPLEGDDYDEAHVKEVTDIFKHVNPERENFRMIIGKIVDDLLVYDAAAIEKLRDLGGKFIGLNICDSSTIFPRLNGYGEFDPEKAYVQLIDNKEVASFKNEDMIFLMQNPATDVKRFGLGCSPLEKVIVSVEAMLKAEWHNLKMFDEDAVPAGMLFLGRMSQDQAGAFRDFWDNTINGRYPQLKFVYSASGDLKPEYTPFKQPNREMQFQEYVDWLTRIILAAYGLTAMDANVLHDINRSTSEAELLLAESRGIRSMKTLISEFINREILQEEFGYTDLEFKFREFKKAELLEQAKIDDIYLKAGVITPDEVRLRDGLKPLAELDDSFFTSPLGMPNLAGDPSHANDTPDNIGRPGKNPNPRVNKIPAGKKTPEEAGLHTELKSFELYP